MHSSSRRARKTDEGHMQACRQGKAKPDSPSSSLCPDCSQMDLGSLIMISGCTTRVHRRAEERGQGLRTVWAVFQRIRVGQSEGGIAIKTGPSSLSVLACSDPRRLTGCFVQLWLATGSASHLRAVEVDGLG